MKLLDNLAASLGYSKGSKSVFGSFGFIDSLTNMLTGLGVGKKIPAKTAMALNIGWVYAGVRAIAEALANVEWRLFRVAKDGTSEEVFDNELLDLLHAVNSNMTGFELKYLTAGHLEFVGNAYWYLYGADDEKKKPTAIYPLNPQYVTPIIGEFPQFIKGYKYSVDGKEQTFTPGQILHFRYPDFDNMFEGRGSVQSIFDWIEADIFATKFNRKYFANGARLSGVLTSKNSISDDQMQKLRTNFDQVYNGLENAHKIGILDNDISYQEMSANPKDMDFVNLQLAMRDKILAGLRVPKTKLGAAESETNRATAETANYVFANDTIKPKIQMITNFLNEFLVPRFGDDLYLDFVNPVPEDQLAKMEEMKAATASVQVMSINEAREKYLGLGPIDNGDEVQTDFNKIPLGAPKAPTKSINRPALKNVSSKFINAKKRNVLRSDLTAELIKAAKEVLEKDVKKIIELKAKGIGNLTHDEYEPIWKEFVVRVTPYEKMQAEIVRKFNKQQKEIVLSNLSKVIKGAKSKAIDENELYDMDNQVSLLVDATKPNVYDLYEKEGVAAAELIGFDNITMMTEAARKRLDLAIGLMSQSYNDTTLGLLKATIEQGLADGSSLVNLEDAVSRIYEFSDISRAAAVARTEMFRVANSANKDAWKETGSVKSVKWYTAKDDGVCEDCAAMDDVETPIEDNFLNMGDMTESGAEIDYSDIENPPLHTNCRCYIRPEEISMRGAKPGKTKEETEEPKPVEEKMTKEEAEKIIAERTDQIKAELDDKYKTELEAKTEEIKQELASQIDELIKD